MRAWNGILHAVVTNRDRVRRNERVLEARRSTARDAGSDGWMPTPALEPTADPAHDHGRPLHERVLREKQAPFLQRDQDRRVRRKNTSGDLREEAAEIHERILQDHQRRRRRRFDAARLDGFLRTTMRARAPTPARTVGKIHAGVGGFDGTGVTGGPGTAPGRGATGGGVPGSVKQFGGSPACPGGQGATPGRAAGAGGRAMQGTRGGQPIWPAPHVFCTCGGVAGEGTPGTAMHGIPSEGQPICPSGHCGADEGGTTCGCPGMGVQGIPSEGNPI